MQFSLDPFALFVAVLALWFTIRESRRSNSIILKVEDCSRSYSQNIDENRQQPFGEFRILIRNRGVPLFDPVLQLSFLETDGGGVASMAIIRRNDGGDGTAQFQRGMIAEFSIKTYELNEHDIHFLCRLNDAAKQRATFRVYSQGFLAKSIPVVSWGGRIKSLWNKAAVWFNYRDLRKKGAGIQVHQVDPKRYVLPAFSTLAFPLERFIESLRKEHGKSVEGHR